MKTAKEIAYGLRTAKTWTDLAPLGARVAARRAEGHPVDLEEALMSSLTETMQIRDRLTERLRDDAERAQIVIGALAHGGRLGGHSLAQQNTFTAATHAAELEVAAEMSRRLLDVFASIGDRVVATTEEREQAASSTAARNREALRLRWEALPAKDVQRAAKAAGVNYGVKADACAALAERGHVPETA